MKSQNGRVSMTSLMTTAGVFCLLVGMSTSARAGIPIPEIDAGSFVTGLSVMAGVTLLITGRRWKRVEPTERDGR